MGQVTVSIAIVFVLLPFALTVATAASAAVNPGCTFQGNHYKCPMVTGWVTYHLQYVQSPPRLDHRRIVNEANRHMQIDYVVAVSTENKWNEYCVNLDEFVPVASQPWLGAVGCIHKGPGNRAFPALHRDPRNLGRGVSVNPYSTIFLSTNIDALNASGVPSATLTFSVYTHPWTVGVVGTNQPEVDRTIPCKGNGSTNWKPYRNNGNQPVRMDSATIYSVVPGGSVDNACTYVLNTSAQVRWSHCSGTRTRGHVTFPRQTIQPGEYIAAQANHTCSGGGQWDWAAYLHVF